MTFHDGNRPGRPPRRRLTRSIEVQEAVKKIILQRRLAVGDPLPTETELMDELGIGRNSVREALKVLEAVGIVDIRHGFGTFVGRTAVDPRIAWTKLGALVEGARIASEQLW